MRKPSFRMIRSSPWFVKLQIAKPAYTADTHQCCAPQQSLLNWEKSHRFFPSQNTPSFVTRLHRMSQKDGEPICPIVESGLDFDQ